MLSAEWSEDSFRLESALPVCRVLVWCPKNCACPNGIFEWMRLDPVTKAKQNRRIQPALRRSLFLLSRSHFDDVNPSPECLNGAVIFSTQRSTIWWFNLQSFLVQLDKYSRCLFCFQFLTCSFSVLIDQPLYEEMCNFLIDTFLIDPREQLSIDQN